MADTTEPVVFDIEGSDQQVSNDPRWLNAQIAKQYAAQQTPAEKPLDQLNQAELKAKVKDLAGQGIEVDTSGVKKKSELVARIQQAMSEANDEDIDDDSDEADDE